MNRRGFLKSFAALLAPALPVLAQPFWGVSILSLAELQRVQRILNGWHNQLLDNYYAVIHPRQWTNLRELEVRTVWEDRWQAYRIARRNGGPEMTARQIMSDWTPPTWWRQNGEIGSFEGMRFIQSARVA